VLFITLNVDGSRCREQVHSYTRSTQLLRRGEGSRSTSVIRSNGILLHRWTDLEHGHASHMDLFRIEMAVHLSSKNARFSDLLKIRPECDKPPKEISEFAVAEKYATDSQGSFSIAPTS
jgi:hypothetical protein